VPAPDEQKKLDDLVKEQEVERRKEEERKAEEQKKREEAKKAAEAKKKAEEKKKREAELKKKKEDERKKKEAEAKAKNFGEDMAALLNKIPDKGAPAPSTEFTAPNAKKGPVLGAPEGRDRTLSASELAILAQIIKSCVQSKWTVMSGGEGADQTIVKIRLRFNPDGRLAGAPTVMNQQNSPLFLAVSDSALRAVQACEPFPLPADKYDVWKDIVLNFDPKDMFGR
jgi:colicin import membrane protein